MRRKGPRLLVLLAVLAIFLIARRSSVPATGDAAVSDSSAVPFRPTVQEGLGVSVAILLDQSGSMRDAPGSGGDEPKFVTARKAIEDVLAQTGAFVAKQSGFPVNVGLYTFSKHVTKVLPIAPYDRAVLQAALESLPRPEGSTAIGEAMEAATRDLYQAGTIRKYLLVVTDGENTSGPSPDDVAREITKRSEGAVKLYMVAFDVDAEKFGFVNEVHGAVLEARDAEGLRANLDTLYRGRILAEAVDAGEIPPPASDTAHRPLPPRPPSPPRSRSPS